MLKFGVLNPFMVFYKMLTVQVDAMLLNLYRAYPLWGHLIWAFAFFTLLFSLGWL